jgi:serine/arginine repetitive matrix protein 2
MDSRRVAHPPQKTIAQRNSNLADINELDRTDSRGSTNFSYPLTARPNSPSPKSSALMQSRWAPGQSQNGLSPQETEAARQRVYESAQQPVKKKKKKVVRGSAEGSHLSGGTMGVRTTVAPQETFLPREEAVDGAEDGQQTTPAKKKKKKVVTSPEDSDVHARPMSPGFSSDSDTTPEKMVKRAQRASGTLNKQPSVVREDWEGEQGDNVRASPVGPVQSTQPSTAANMSRKMNEVPIEPKPIGRHAPMLAVNVPAPKLDIPPSSAAQPAGNGYLDVGRSTSQGSRQTSLSPSRSKTRFSKNLSSDLSAERKHEPLPRSVSPVKSAMKHHSPSHQESTMDAIVPGAWQRTSTTPSEASDNNSMASEQGLTSAAKKKKSARVSFGEGAEIVGVSQTTPNDSPILASPQHKDTTKKGWFGLGKSKSPLGTIPAEDDMEEVMKPRPMLPSFGSVRGKSRSNDTPEQRTPSTTLHDSVTVPNSSHDYNSTMMPSSSEPSTTSVDPTDTSVSSDHAIGSILAQDKTQNRLPNGIHDNTHRQPLPPVVTSVEGTGYVSDSSESIYSEDEKPHHIVEEQSQQVVEEQPREDRSTITETANAGESVPTIAVQPATPAIEQQDRDDMYVSLPGGFPASADTLESTSRGHSTEQQPSEFTPAGLGISEPLPQGQVTSQRPASPTAKSLSEALRQLDQEYGDEESSAGDSIYSDAEEDLSYMDGYGFGSINAIVESQIVKSPANRITTPPESPITKELPSQTAKLIAGSRTESWEQTQAHWSEVAQRRRQEKEQPPNTVPESDLSQPSKPKKKKKKKHLNITVGEVRPEVLASMNSRQTSTQPEAPIPATTSRQVVPAGRGDAPVRTSTKSEPEVEESPQFRCSMRSGPTSTVATEPQRPVETSQRMSKPRGTLQKKHIPSTAAGLAAADAADARAHEKQRIGTAAQLKQATPVPAAPVQAIRTSKAAPLQRTFSNDSDSSSSFRKRRKGTAASDGKYTMRRSMRGGQSTDARQLAQSTPPQPASRGGIRSISPINRRPFSATGGQSTMRSSMRTSGDSGPRTMRNQEGHQRSSSGFAGFGKLRPKSAAALPSKIKSRFADSDDEDATSPKVFNSRFEDSSDDEPEPVKLRPVRGIPRKIDEGDSTDLEDSSDIEKEIEKSRAAAQPGLAVNTSAGNGVVNAGDVPQSPTKERKGFFGRFRSKKEKDKNSRMSRAALESSVQKQAYLDQARTEMDRAKSPELGKSKSPEGERTKSPEPSNPKQPSSTAPELQRRLTPNRIMSDQFVPQRIPSESWPLPPKIGAADGDRPYTADGVASGSSPVITGSEYPPGMPQRHNTASTVRTAGGTPVFSEKTGRKKRFPKLRKAFGLYD